MSKTSSSLHVRDGVITGKTVTTRYDDGCTKSTSYKATGSGLGRVLLGPDYSATSTTTTDRGGNTRTTSYKKSSWW
jgi:hypothetical protein